MNLPDELRYTEEHEWVRVEGNTAIIGITDFAQSELGDIVFVELPEEGSDIQTGDVFGSVESVKTVSELYAPISGKVIAVNGELEDTPEHVNQEAYKAGWMIKVEIADESELANLLSAAQYQESISE
ncbi:glycine cleavage system protein GcvH [Shimazuella sp. AN120528]|uniref:glycine cleavage system protein GcvH n=1 Tax=Shimazuella soli TaxID=1892854 RepID=UPI001F100C19|nr:glycine cleavage system protein GcvH [Shimazuella soli]MCH5583374.1 glycine cleavage system protein GcvH [Shimazuella soli]